MKKVVILAVIFMGAIYVTNLFGAQRKVLAEMFTNTSCGPCGPANPALDAIYENHQDIMTVIRYHTWWPSSSDPFYQNNVTENTMRINYYDIPYTPDLMVDGLINATSDYSTWENWILIRSQVSSPVTIQLSVYYDSTSRSGWIRSVVHAETTADYTALKIRYALIENEVYYPAPNGEVYHNQAMRDMLPTAGGVPITLSAGETVVDTQEFTIDPNWDQNNCQIVVFVQEDISHQVHQSEVTDVMVNVAEEYAAKTKFWLRVPRLSNVSTPLTLEINAVEQGIYTIDVFDVSGARVFTRKKEINSKNLQSVLINSGSLSKPGAYFIRVTSPNHKVMTVKTIRIR